MGGSVKLPAEDESFRDTPAFGSASSDCLLTRTQQSLLGRYLQPGKYIYTHICMYVYIYIYVYI